MNILELYAGIGGMHYALQESAVEGTVIAAVEINIIANQVYESNFPSTTVLNRNIESLTAEQIRNMNIDTIFMSPPCQPFTKNGLQKDVHDARTTSFFHILELIPQLSNLKHILLENVEPFEQSISCRALISCLIKNGFNYKEVVLSPKDFGIPNSRTRYFLLAKKNTISFCLSKFNESRISLEQIIEILSYLYDSMKVKCPVSAVNKCMPLKKIIKLDYDETSDKVNASLPINILEKHLNVLDIRNSESTGSCCFTSAYGRYAKGTGSVYSPLPTIEIDEKLKQLQSVIPKSKVWRILVQDLKLRYFTPKEISQIMGFPNSFSFQNSISTRQKYKLIGNSICVHIVKYLVLILDYIPRDNNQ